MEQRPLLPGLRNSTGPLMQSTEKSTVEPIQVAKDHAELQPQTYGTTIVTENSRAHFGDNVQVYATSALRSFCTAFVGGLVVVGSNVAVSAISVWLGSADDILPIPQLESQPSLTTAVCRDSDGQLYAAVKELWDGILEVKTTGVAW